MELFPMFATVGGIVGFFVVFVRVAKDYVRIEREIKRTGIVPRKGL